jgi:hypothetical protein
LDHQAVQGLLCRRFGARRSRIARWRRCARRRIARRCGLSIDLLGNDQSRK